MQNIGRPLTGNVLSHKNNLGNSLCAEKALEQCYFKICLLLEIEYYSPEVNTSQRQKQLAMH